ncbi:MAG: amidohydrolase family protein [Acidimicrobiales bacterium]
MEAAGYLVLSAPAEPHAHLDKALTADRVLNPAGDLLGAINAWIQHRSTIAKADFVERATRALEMGLANGTTAVRTHLDIGSDIGTTGVEALLDVKAAMAGRVDLQLVGLVSSITDRRLGPGNRAALIDAIDLGLDVVGGVPHLEPDPRTALEWLMEQADTRALPLDLHTDENLEPGSLDLETLAERVLAEGFGHGVVASHCVSLGIQPAEVQRRVAEKVAAAGVAVVALPQTNLFLQARGVVTAPPRGLTAVAALTAAGVDVAAGADNLQDPFCLVGRADAFETAALMVMTAHLTPETAYGAVSTNARRAMGLGPTDDLLAVRAASLREAIASAPHDRVVVRDGAVVACAQER